MNFSELKGRAVVDLEDAKKIGEVDDLLLDPATRQTIGLVLKSGGLFSHAQTVPLSQINRIGSDAIMVTQAGTSPNTASAKNVEIVLSDILNNKVVTDAGTYVGQISDVLIDGNTLNITGYVFKPDGMFAKSHEFAAAPQIRYGEKLVTVPESLINQPGQNA